MPKNVELLLTENVDSLGIVGDVVRVRTGFARNFLLPQNLATKPSKEMIQKVAARRAEAQRQVAELRAQREALVRRLQGVEITMIRSCNDLGHLYAAVTQQEIAAELEKAGYPGVRPRDVRLSGSIKRIDNYDVHIKFDAELDSVVKLHVQADRKLDLDRARDEQAEREASAEAKAGAEAVAGEPKASEKAPAPAAGEKPAEKPKKPKGEKKEKDPAAKAGKSDAAEPTSGPKKEVWGKVVDQGPAMPEARPRRERR
ncbi:50S ribosomal protein L9 [Leptolyngbya sp. 15MV]|nr:50S ribosomal protein L9 [Leptolyngbya sp. 15MV]